MLVGDHVRRQQEIVIHTLSAWTEAKLDTTVVLVLGSAEILIRGQFWRKVNEEVATRPTQLFMDPSTLNYGNNGDITGFGQSPGNDFIYEHGSVACPRRCSFDS